MQKSCEKEDCNFVSILEIERLSKNTQIGSGLRVCLQSAESLPKKGSEPMLRSLRACLIVRNVKESSKLTYE